MKPQILTNLTFTIFALLAINLMIARTNLNAYQAQGRLPETRLMNRPYAEYVDETSSSNLEGSSSPAGEYRQPEVIRSEGISAYSNIAPRTGRTTQMERNSYYYNSYNANRTGPTSPTYVDSLREAAVESNSPPRYIDNGMTRLNREYNTVSDYDFNRSAATTVTSSATLTEVQLLSMLNPQARSMYLSLDPEAKSLAIQLASQDSYRDKNLAVKEAHRRMNERRGIMSR